MDELLYSVRNVEAVREQMLQIDGTFKILIEVHGEYNSLLPIEMQHQDEDCIDDIDEKMMSCTGLARKKKAGAWSLLAFFYPRQVVSYR